VFRIKLKGKKYRYRNSDTRKEQLRIVHACHKEETLSIERHWQGSLRDSKGKEYLMMPKKSDICRHLNRKSGSDPEFGKGVHFC